MSAEESRPAGGGNHNITTGQLTDSAASAEVHQFANQYEMSTGFLDWLFGQERDDLISICRFMDRSGLKAPDYATFDDNARASEYAQALDVNSQGTYFRFTTLPFGFAGRRGTNEQSAYAYCLHGDFDLRGPGHVAEHYPTDRIDYDRLLEKAGLPEPSAWLNSGGGLNPIWKLSQRVPASDAVGLLADWAAHINAWAKTFGWKMDGTFDLARVAGMPGTHNRKPDWNSADPLRSVETLTDAAWSAGELRAILAGAPTPSGSSVEPARSGEAPFASPSQSFGSTPVVQREERLFTDEQAAEFMDRAVDRLRRDLHEGNVYRSMSAFLLTGLHFEANFPGYNRGALVDVLSVVAREAMGWEVLDENDREKVSRAFQKWDDGRVDDPWIAQRVLVPVVIEEALSQWAPKDISAVLGGDRTRVVPTLGRRQDGARVLYAGKEHSISSEPECGKTWWVLLQVMDILNEGGRVTYVDFEDDENTIVGRLLDMGCPPSLLGGETFRYLNPDTAPPAQAIKRLCMFGDIPADLMVLDGVTEGMGTMGLDPLSQKDIVKWRAVAKEAMRCGTAILSTDHETKNKETRGRFAIGGQHKLAGLNGVMFKMENVTPFNKDGGRTKVFFTKDRNGGLRDICPGANSEGLTHFGDLVNEGGKWHLYPPKQDAIVDSIWPAEHAKKIRAILPFLYEKPNQSGNAVEAKVGGAAAGVKKALQWLLNEEYVSQTPGPNRSKLHSLTFKGNAAVAEMVRPEEQQE